jgi:hypothetical protein
MDRPLVGRASALLLILAFGDDAFHRQPGKQAGYIVQTIAEDIRTAGAAAVFIDRTEHCQACPPGFSVAGYLETDPRIQQALGAYARAGVMQNLDVFVRRQR